MMTTKEEIINALSDIKHPVIDYSLIDLGIIKDIALENKKVKILFKLPFPDIPIKDILINSTAEPILAIGMKFEYEIQIMSEDEKQRFIIMETKGWRI